MAKKDETPEVSFEDKDDAPEGTELFLDFEDGEVEEFKFQFPKHYKGKRLNSQHRCDDKAQVVLSGTRDTVAAAGRIFTRFYGAKLVK